MKEINDEGYWFLEQDFDILKKEKNKARDLRRSQWWKNKRAFNRCHYCGGDFNAKSLTMDHVVPLSMGGKTRKSNLVPACKECNTKKRNMSPLDWKLYSG